VCRSAGESPTFRGSRTAYPETGHPRDHARTIKLLLEAGAPLDPTILPTGDDELDAVMRRWLKERDRHEY
jgi:hypothetical protein